MAENPAREKTREQLLLAKGRKGWAGLGAKVLQ